MKKIHTFESFLTENLNEGAIEYIDKNDKEKMISVFDKPGYLVLKQTDFSNNQSNFIISKDQIKDLIAVLNKFAK